MGGEQQWIEIGERVREAREAAGLTQGRLAEIIGIERTALVRVESGQRQAVLRAHQEGLLTAARVVELLGGGLTVDDLPDRDEAAP